MTADVKSPAAPPNGKALRDQVIAAVGGAIQERVSALVARPSFWIAFVGIIAGALIIGALRREMPRPPRVRLNGIEVPFEKLTLPPFELTNQRGERFGLAELKGRVWVADFVFTSCPTVCPKLTTRMAEVQHRARNLGDAFHIVTFTVDPETDTPERLATYARTYKASPRRWTFLTGPLGDVETTVVKGFKLAMGKEEASPGTAMSFFHEERFVLVDAKGVIRGYYEADKAGIDQLMRDVGIVANLR